MNFVGYYIFLFFSVSVCGSEPLLVERSVVANDLANRLPAPNSHLPSVLHLVVVCLVEPLVVQSVLLCLDFVLLCLSFCITCGLAILTLPCGLLAHDIQIIETADEVVLVENVCPELCRDDIELKKLVLQFQ